MFLNLVSFYGLQKVVFENTECVSDVRDTETMM